MHLIKITLVTLCLYFSNDFEGLKPTDFDGEFFIFKKFIFFF